MSEWGCEDVDGYEEEEDRKENEGEGEGERRRVRGQKEYKKSVKKRVERNFIGCFV